MEPPDNVRTSGLFCPDPTAPASPSVTSSTDGSHLDQRLRLLLPHPAPRTPPAAGPTGYRPDAGEAPRPTRTTRPPRAPPPPLPRTTRPPRAERPREPMAATAWGGARAWAPGGWRGEGVDVGVGPPEGRPRSSRSGRASR